MSKKVFSVVITVLLTLVLTTTFCGCGEEPKKEPELTGTKNGVNYYIIHYSYETDVSNMFNIEKTGVYHCAISNYAEPNAPMMSISGDKITKDKYVIHCDDKNFFIFCDGNMGSDTFNSIAMRMIGTDAMPYEDGEKYIKAYLK